MFAVVNHLYLNKPVDEFREAVQNEGCLFCKLCKDSVICISSKRATTMRLWRCFGKQARTRKTARQFSDRRGSPKISRPSHKEKEILEPPVRTLDDVLGFLNKEIEIENDEV